LNWRRRRRRRRRSVTYWNSNYFLTFSTGFEATLLFLVINYVLSTPVGRRSSGPEVGGVFVVFLCTVELLASPIKEGKTNMMLENIA
jgi:hypothetical protein